MEIKKVYIAAPFFNEIQERVVENIKMTLKSINLDFYSPKDELRYKKGDFKEVAVKCFNKNIEAMNECDFMIAVIDDFDPGVLFEMGYFKCLNKSILTYSDVKGRTLNLMLTQACIGFTNGLSELVDKLIRIKSGEIEQEEFKGQQQ